jgi:hypothetical protein
MSPGMTTLRERRVPNPLGCEYFLAPPASARSRAGSVAATIRLSFVARQLAAATLSLCAAPDFTPSLEWRESQERLP